MVRSAQKLPSSSLNMSEELRRRILRVIDEVDRGFKNVMQMYLIAFYMGIVLISAGSLATLYFGENKFLLLFGSIGILDVIAFVVFKPVEDLQRSRGNLAQLVAAFLTWYVDTANWNEVFEGLGKRGADLEEFKKVSRISIVNTVTIMSAIELFVASKESLGKSGKIKAAMEEIMETLKSP